MRSEEEKWRVPESDPAGEQPIVKRRPPKRKNAAKSGDSEPLPDVEEVGHAELIFCGQCGALNPATSHYCAACGATLLDAFHASEGLRVYERPDTATRLIEIVPAGNALDIVEDPDAPTDFVRVKLSTGRLGYIRLADVEALARADPEESDRLDAPNINTRARGCVTPAAAVVSLILLVLLARLVVFLLEGENNTGSGFLALIFCFVLTPLAFLIVGIYLWSNNREARLEAEEEEARRSRARE